MNPKYFKNSFLILILTLMFFLSPFTTRAEEQSVEISLDRQDDWQKIFKNMTSLSDIDLYFENKTGKQLKEMKVSETGLFDKTPWEPYSAMKKWHFSPPDGQKPVYAQFKTVDGEIVNSGATFIYDTIPPDVSFHLITKSIGPDTLNIIGSLNGQDIWSVTDYDYRMGQTSILENEVWFPRTSNLVKIPVNNFALIKDGEIKTVYLQVKDAVGNVSPTLSDSYTVDKTPPQVFIQISPSDSLSQEIQIFAYDAYSELKKMQISNDLFFINGVKEMPYQEKVWWEFDDKRIVWIKIWDTVGNVTEEYPAYLSPKTSPSPSLSWTPTPINEKPTPTVNPTIASDPKYLEFQTKIEALEKGQQELETTSKNIQESVQKQGERISVLQTILDSIVSALKSLFPFLGK